MCHLENINQRMCGDGRPDQYPHDFPQDSRRVIKLLHRFREILGEVATELELEILALEVMPDHVHLFVNAPPDLAPAEIIARIKGRTSHHMRREFPAITRMPSMWTRSYFVSTAGNVSSETIERYIAMQKKRG